MQICYAKFRAWLGGGGCGGRVVTLAHGQDSWVNVHDNYEFPDSPEPIEPARGVHIPHLRASTSPCLLQGQ